MLPKRFSQRRRDPPIKIFLCRECHDQLEKKIPYEKVPDRVFYFQVVIEFLDIDLEEIGMTPEQLLIEILPLIVEFSRNPEIEELDLAAVI